jgi:hypothetical protein
MLPLNEVEWSFPQDGATLLRLTVYLKEEIIMKYRVHRFELQMEKDQLRLEEFLNSLAGQIVSIIPNVKPTFQLMGATAKVNFLLIVETV